ncbi:DNA-binding NtrC family response regulator [Gellertiella hungarica]|uniref:DNA-binding NtrC family response regulator n=1 Tax=Gellertiella hungarica TaxID=1572859 RepID=A0A7W6J9B6_9HYPH|nr:DNA-binding NtrC family response regulator [Gellertiella hungarica]
MIEEQARQTDSAVNVPVHVPVQVSPPSHAFTEKKRVLVVEDDFLIRLNTMDMLEELGHDIAEAASAEEALALLETQTFDVLLTDMGLPRMSGTELACTVRERLPDLGLIFATGHHDLPDVPGRLRPVLLQKPFDMNDIRRAIEQALGR